jgi:rhamnose transport system permease protein
MSAGNHPSPHRRRRRRLRSVVAALLPPLLLALTLALVFARLRPSAAASLYALWRPWAEVGALACGMTAVIVAGGIDLSIGALVVLCGAVLGFTCGRLAWPLGLACGTAALTGTLAGALNGRLVTLGIAPFVATLATMAVFSELALALSGRGGLAAAGFPPGFTRFAQANVLGVPCQLWLLLAAALAWGGLLHRSRIGRTWFALGDNPTAAAFAALPVRRRLAWLYTLNGLLAGVVAVAIAARSGVIIPDAGSGLIPGLELELPVIACVVLGGTRITGGAGGIGRTVIGVAILAHLEIGLRMLGNLAIHFPGTRLTLPVVLDASTRLIGLGILLVAFAVLNERLATPREGA